MPGYNAPGWAYPGEGPLAAVGGNPTQVDVGFISSATVVHAPSLTEVDPGFIASTTVVHAPTLVAVIGRPSLVLDDFNRANEADITAGAFSGLWRAISGSHGVRVVGNQAADESGQTDNGAVQWTAITEADCEAFLTLAAPPTSLTSHQTRLWLRMASGVMTGYSANIFGATDNTVTITKWVAGTPTVLVTGGTVTPQAGDQYSFQAIGSQLSLYRKPSGGTWRLVATVSDATYTAGGYIGFGVDDSATGRVDDFGGGNAQFPFIASVSTVYDLSPGNVEADLPFIASVTAVFAPTLASVAVIVPFIASRTRVFGVFSLYMEVSRSGVPGNGGERFGIRLAPNGASETATLVGSISDSATLLELTGDGGMPTTEPFCLTVDDEVLYVAPIGAGLYRIRRRGLSNTAAATHITGADATWTDSYDLAIVSTVNIAESFTADITSTGSFTYPGWLICFDSSQAYLAGDRYPMHVTEVLGVFDAGAGSTGSNRCDAAQPNAICTAAAVSDDCPAALSNPSRIQTDILVGDVAVVRYTNPEASALDLGERSVALQSWFGMKRVDFVTGADVTLTDPAGVVVDGSVNGEWDNPLGPGIGPDTGEPTNHDVPYTSVTLLGADRRFTVAVEQGWPICALAVRQGTRRIPFWRSWDWHEFNYVYSGFDADATFCQLAVNRNGIVFGAVPEVDLPGPQDIDGPDAVWDDGSYQFAASWYVAIYSGPYLVGGPAIGGTDLAADPTFTGGYVPVVSFPVDPSTPVVGVPDVEGGSGGGIPPPIIASRFSAALV